MKTDRKYTMEELSLAVSNYQHAKKTWDEASGMVAAKRSQMESFMKDEAIAKAEMDRHEAIVKGIVKDLE